MNLKLFAKNNKVLADTSDEAVKTGSLDSRLGTKTVKMDPTLVGKGSEPTTPVDVDLDGGPISPSRRTRVKSLGQKNIDAASTDRMKRNTDSMLEDAVVSGYLKKR